MADFALTAKKSKAAVASLVLAVISFLGLGPLAALPGFLLGLAGIKRTRAGGLGGRGIAVAGLLLSTANVALLVAAFSMPEVRAWAVGELDRRGIRIDVPGLGDPVIARNEEEAVKALRKLHSAQLAHRAQKGTYAKGVAELAAMNPSVAGPAESRAKRVPHGGYFFSSLLRQGAGSVDHAKGFFIIAMPAEYGASGRRPFAVGPAGGVLAKDTGGQPVTNTGELAGWQVILEGGPE